MSLVGWWVAVAIPCAVYYWAKRTDPRTDPFERRMAAVAWGLAWPMHVISSLRKRP